MLVKPGIVCGTLLLAALASQAWAAPTVPALPSAPAPLTLSRVLTSAHGRDLLLTVGADRLTLPKGHDAPPEGASLDQIADAFSEQTRVFGRVTTVAPATYVALNEDPGLPDMGSDLSSLTAFKMLAARLDDAQWQALTSEQGLGLSDLTDDTQIALFHALFRRGRLWVASEDPALTKLPDDQRTDTRDLSDQISQVHFRLGQTSHLYLHDTSGATLYYGSGQRPDAAARLHTWGPKQPPPAAEHNVLLRTTLPNTPKDGALNFGDSDLQASVSLSGVKTVDGLVARIAAQTRRELYADPHYARRAVTVLGTQESAPAADLLRALALCLAATYRKVGPGFVLTDDLSGVGARRQRLQEWEDAATNNNIQMGDQAGAILLARRVSSARTLPSFGDPLALTPSELQALKPSSLSPSLPDDYGNNVVPFSALSPAQQDLARQIAADYEDHRSRSTLPDYLTDGAKPPGSADLTRPVDLREEYTVQMLVPGLGTPVDTNLRTPISLLFWPGMAEATKRELAAAEAKHAPSLPPALPLNSILRSLPRRALIGHPHTIGEVDALISAMQKMGLNELWLDVFSDGVAHIPGTPLSPPASSPAAPDILTEALARAKEAGISVYADLSLLAWGEKPFSAVRDLDILGRTSGEAGAAAHARSQEPDIDDAGNIVPFVLPPVAVSPAAPAVREDLAALVRALAARPGLGGFVWQDVTTSDSLGQTPEMRLGFLRLAHADPLDITPTNYARVDLSLPQWDDDGAEQAVTALWGGVKTLANTQLLQALRAADVSGLPILMEQSTNAVDWLASWDSAKQTPPPLQSDEEKVPSNTPDDRVAAAARRRNRTVILHETVKDENDPQALARKLAADLKNAPWSGYVLDFDDDAATRSLHPLAALTAAVSSPNLPAPH